MYLDSDWGGMVTAIKVTKMGVRATAVHPRARLQRQVQFLRVHLLPRRESRR